MPINRTSICDARKEQAQHFRDQASHLEYELHAVRPELYRAGLKIGRLEEQVAALSAENAVLKQRVKELTVSVQQASGTKAEVPAFGNIQRGHHSN